MVFSSSVVTLAFDLNHKAEQTITDYKTILATLKTKTKLHKSNET